ncbi:MULTISPECIES: SHOCT domain-containing protein [unclassified Arthrobacter]|uniref:SHOCT domain-containing protein n=1 Tax=unclassified Arthrobacter TaxID=235627 RepID=UPI001C8558C7|nr:SHOCT domain-containing protein [Arthrobacter sp. MAHUQ-56]MBX7444885.1 SHOCT domain-containing protein [Arthrobacter sp. MAHUQ-56]
MMWGYGQGGGWWLWGVLLLLGIALLVVLAVWAFVGGIRGGGTRGWQGHGRPPASTARRILDERFARGELTADQYREQLRVLGEGP